MSRKLEASTLAAAIAVALHAPFAGAATIDVDHVTCAMVNAIIAANTDIATGGCTAGSGADKIRVVADFDNGFPPLPAITTDVTIVGVFNPPTRFANEGGALFTIGAPSTGGDFAPNVSLRYLDMAAQRTGGSGASGGGGAAGMGGCIYVHAGTVTVERSRLQCGAVGGQASLGPASFTVLGGGGGGGFGGLGGAAAGGSGTAGATAVPYGGGGGGGGSAGATGAAGGGPNGGSAGTQTVAPTAGGPGGGGGSSAGSNAPAIFAAAAGGTYGGGGGGGGGSGTRGGNGGSGGFGAGGGAGGAAVENGGGDAGRGGFGGGSGTVGPGQPNGASAAGGRFGGVAQASTSGSGAGLGGAVFVRTGQMQLTDTAFTSNLTFGGFTGVPATIGAAKGGAVFALDSLVNGNGNDQGMPGALPVVGGCGNTFTTSTAANAGVTDIDNVDTFGVSRSLLIAPCVNVFVDGFEDF